MILVVLLRAVGDTTAATAKAVLVFESHTKY